MYKRQAYALTDELGMAFLCLLDPLGIGYLATADADEVYLTVGYELVGKLRVIHTAYALSLIHI